MGNYNLGSFATDILVEISDIPDSISGNLPVIVYRQIITVENYTNASIGSLSIAQTYQPAIYHLAASETCQLMEAQGVDASSVSLADFSINKGGQSNLKNLSDYHYKRGIEELKRLGYGSRNYQTFYG